MLETSFYIVFLPAIISLVISSISAYLTVKTYQRYRFLEMALLCIGYTAYCMHPLIFTIFYFIHGSEYTNARTLFAIFQLISATFGYFTIWLAYESLSGYTFTWRKFALIGLTLFGLGYGVNGFHAVYNSQQGIWDLFYEPTFAIVAVGLPLLWVTTEIFILSVKSHNTAREDEKFQFKLVIVGWLMGLLTLIGLMIERSIHPNSLLYLIFASIGLATMAIALRKDPFVLIPRTINGEYLIVSRLDSGLPLIIHNFKSDIQNDDDPQTYLFSGAMRGILSLLGEITGNKEDVPDKFGYVNYSIVIECSNSYIAYLVCSRLNNAVRFVLREILEGLEVNNKKSFFVTSQEREELHSIIKRKLNFV